MLLHEEGRTETVRPRLSPVPVPLPLVQIGLGSAIAAFADLGVVLDPQLFFLLFLPPLLFLDGWRIPKAGLLRDKFVILELAFGLVVFTVLVILVFFSVMSTGQSAMFLGRAPWEPFTKVASSGMTSINMRKPSFFRSKRPAIFSLGFEILGSRKSSAGS